MTGHNWTKWIVLLVSAVLVSGCGRTYNVGGTFADSDKPFYGTVAVFFDNGSIDVATEDGQLVCKGKSWVTKRPSLSANTGARGRATATCNDGRTFKIDFLQTTETGGKGRGIDSQGNVIDLVFDTLESEVKLQVRETMLRKLTE